MSFLARAHGIRGLFRQLLQGGVHFLSCEVVDGQSFDDGPFPVGDGDWEGVHRPGGNAVASG